MAAFAFYDAEIEDFSLVAEESLAEGHGVVGATQLDADVDALAAFLLCLLLFDAERGTPTANGLLGSIWPILAIWAIEVTLLGEVIRNRSEGRSCNPCSSELCLGLLAFHHICAWQAAQ